MAWYRLVMALAVMLLAACASEQRLQDLDDTLNLYQAKFRWSNFDDILRFHHTSKAMDLADYKRLQAIRITSYEEKQRIITSDLEQAEQVVIISYYDKDSGMEHQLLTKQVWKYDEDNQTWFLESDLPDFTHPAAQ